jgi:hypothetical protein
MEPKKELENLNWSSFGKPGEIGTDFSGEMVTDNSGEIGTENSSDRPYDFFERLPPSASKEVSKGWAQFAPTPPAPALPPVVTATAQVATNYAVGCATEHAMRPVERGIIPKKYHLDLILPHTNLLL